MCRRYREWETLHDQLVANRVYNVPPLPAKKFFGNLDANFLKKRERELDAWLRNIFQQYTFAQDEALAQWLQPTQVDQEMILEQLGSAYGVMNDERDRGPPVMQGELLFMRPGEEMFSTQWFELRGVQLWWFDRAGGTMKVSAVTFSFLCQLLEKYGTLIERNTALIEKVSPCIKGRNAPGPGQGEHVSIVAAEARCWHGCILFLDTRGGYDLRSWRCGGRDDAQLGLRNSCTERRKERGDGCA
eukprot:SAG31_NODE_1982_length_6745_cov_8.400090_2_plen_244_part_00